jgi:hypothetical protein
MLAFSFLGMVMISLALSACFFFLVCFFFSLAHGNDLAGSVRFFFSLAHFESKNHIGILKKKVQNVFLFHWGGAKMV